jgi:hypothetical protein
MKYSIFIYNSCIYVYISNQKIRKKLAKILKKGPHFPDFPSDYVVIVNDY